MNNTSVFYVGGHILQKRMTTANYFFEMRYTEGHCSSLHKCYIGYIRYQSNCVRGQCTESRITLTGSNIPLYLISAPHHCITTQHDISFIIPSVTNDTMCTNKTCFIHINAYKQDNKKSRIGEDTDWSDSPSDFFTLCSLSTVQPDPCKLPTQFLTWYEAESRCRERNGTLPMFHSRAQVQELITRINMRWKTIGFSSWNCYYDVYQEVGAYVGLLIKVSY